MSFSFPLGNECFVGTKTNKIPIFPDDFIEIKQGEYRRIKNNDPKNVNGYTARIMFKFFKLKSSINIEELMKEIERLKLNIKVMQERIDKLNEEKR